MKWHKILTPIFRTLVFLGIVTIIPMIIYWIFTGNFPCYLLDNIEDYYTLKEFNNKPKRIGYGRR